MDTINISENILRISQCVYTHTIIIFSVCIISLYICEENASPATFIYDNLFASFTVDLRLL